MGFYRLANAVVSDREVPVRAIDFLRDDYKAFCLANLTAFFWTASNLEVISLDGIAFNHMPVACVMASIEPTVYRTRLFDIFVSEFAKSGFGPCCPLRLYEPRSRPRFEPEPTRWDIWQNQRLSVRRATGV